MKIAFFGTPAFAAEFLKGLLSDPAFEVVLVVTQPDEPVGRKKIITPPAVKLLAVEHKIPVCQPTKLKHQDFQTLLTNSGAEIGVVVAYGRLLPDEVLLALRLGFINVHPSLLPKYRGPSPIIAALANGDSETGVTIMKLVKDMDAGPILAQEVLELEPQETAHTLTGKVVAIGSPLLNTTLKDFASGIIEPKDQDHTQATFCKLLTRADGEIDWSQPAEVIERKIRAYNPWPGTATNTLKIFNVSFSQRSLPSGEQLIEGGKLFIGTGTLALEILELQPSGGKRMAAGDFLRGRSINSHLTERN